MDVDDVSSRRVLAKCGMRLVSSDSRSGQNYFSTLGRLTRCCSLGAAGEVGKGCRSRLSGIALDGPKLRDSVRTLAAREVIRCMIDVFDTGDTSKVGSFIANEYLDHQGLGGAEIRGSGGFRRVVEVARSGFSDLRVSIEDLIEGADRVAVRVLWVGTRKADGVAVLRETIDIVRCERGKAVEHWGVRTWIDPA